MHDFRFIDSLPASETFDSFDVEVQTRGDKQAGVNYFVPHCGLIH
jgi:hypothetical protein